MISRRHVRSLPFVFGLVALLAIDPSPISAASGDAIRTGLWVMQKLPAEAQTLHELESQLRANHNLSGVCLHISWDQIEKESGKPSFDDIDQTVAIFRRAGMKYQLCLKPGVHTPAFVYAEGARAFETQISNRNRRNFGAAVKIPVPWDPAYERAFERVIKQLGERYARDPLCVSVVLTCANFMSAEMHLPKAQSDLARWRALDNYELRLFEVYKKFTDVWATAFPTQEISLHLSRVLDLPPSFQEGLIDYGLDKYPKRFSIQSCQLTGRKEDTGGMTYDLVQKYRDRAHHGFQSLAGLNGPDGRMGSPEIAALNLVHAGAEYWELWHGDGFSVTTSSQAASVWREARQLGYEAYKKKLIAEGQYRQRR